MTTTFTEDLKQRYAGELSDGEKQVCAGFRNLLGAALRGQIGFREAMEALWTGLSILRPFSFDVVDKAIAARKLDPSALQRTAELRASIGRGSSSLSNTERAFLEDADGLIDWATRNGVSFLLLLKILAHDVGELVRHDFDLEKTLREILPKVTGWAALNTAPIGEAEEQA